MKQDIIFLKNRVERNVQVQQFLLMVFVKVVLIIVKLATQF